MTKQEIVTEILGYLLAERYTEKDQQLARTGLMKANKKELYAIVRITKTVG